MAATSALFVVMLLLYSTLLDRAAATLGNETIISGIAWGEMNLYLRNSYTVYHMEEDLLYPGNILFSDERSIKTTDGENITILAGNPNAYGYLEGVGTAAKMNHITGFHQINSTHILFSDQANHCLRILDRTTRETTTFTGKCGSSGFQDGIEARFYSPWSIIKDEVSGGKIIIADSSNSAMRRVDLNTRRVTTLYKMASTTPRSMAISTPGHLLITQRYMISELNVAIRHNTRIVGSTSSGSRNGPFDTAQFSYMYEIINFGDEVYLTVGSNDVIRIIDRKNSWVRSICSGTEGTLNGNLISCQLDNPRSLLFMNDMLYIGDDYGIRKMTVKKFNPYSQCPPDQISAQVAEGEDEAAVEVVPGVVAHLPPGYHKFGLAGTSCVTYISVTGPGMSDLVGTCPTEVIVVAEVGTKEGYYEYKAAGVTHRLSLPLGVHAYSYESEGKNCSVQIRVIGSNLKRRLDFIAKYKVNCGSAESGENPKLLRALAFSRYSQIEEICLGKCGRLSGTTSLIDMSCVSNVLTVRWPTDTTFNGGVTRLPTDLLDSLRTELKRRTKILDLVFYFTQMPSAVYPVVDENGLPATPILTSICSGGQKYDSTSDSCVD